MASEYFVGLDLGQSRDYTALCVLTPDEAYQVALQRREELYSRLERTRRDPHTDRADLEALEREIERKLEHEPDQRLPEPTYHVRHLERMQLGTPYTAAAQRVRSIMQSPQLIGLARLVVDQTGVGAAVVDILHAEGLDFAGVTITAGERSTRDGSNWRVPKRNLIARAQVLLQNRRLKIAPALPEASTLVKELEAFRVKVSQSGHDSYEAWREGDHDDLVLALCLALWSAERGSTGVDEMLSGSTGLYSGIPDEDLYTLDSRDLYGLEDPLY